ncbi:MAG: Ig-like domain-containing protein [Butyrivibrio sp.]
MKNKIKIMAAVALITTLIPLQTMAGAYWEGKNVYREDLYGQYWNVNAGEIIKTTNPGRIFDINDIENYSAYITNNAELVGNTMEKSFCWYNRSRLAYVRLIKVTPGQTVAFSFPEEFYVYCAEFNKNMELVDEGGWFSTEETHKISSDTEWIIPVFRQANGDLANMGGLDTTITAEQIAQNSYRYFVSASFKYTFDLNGGVFMNFSGTFTGNRWGTHKFTMPVPVREGYIFKGWKSSGGKIYSGTLKGYDEELFKDNEFTAVWAKIVSTGISLNQDEAVLEQNSDDSVLLTATVEPENAADKTVTWVSSDESVATVDANGLVTGKNTGVATITASTKDGNTASCKIYVMSFEVSVPSSCTLCEAYEIRIDVYNNGNKDTKGRKYIILDTDERIEVKRTGDEQTVYPVAAEVSGTYNGEFVSLKNGEYLANTADSGVVYYRLTPAVEIDKAGDYSGSVTFSVLVK